MRDKIDTFYQHEGLDRTHTLLVMLDNLLGYCDCDTDIDNLHPSIYNALCRSQLTKANEALGELYQLIGKWEEVK